MYPVGDPRRALQSDASPVLQVVPRAPQFFEFGSRPPTEISAGGSHTWLVRTENLVLAYTEGRAGDVFDCSSTLDEVVVMMPDEGSSASVLGTIRTPVPGGTVAVIPADSAALELHTDGRLVRVFSVRSTDLTSMAMNADAYRQPHPLIPPFEAWDDVAADRTQVTGFSDIGESPVRFGRIFRSDAAMMNIFHPTDGPRDPAKLSPHSHADFDQLSLQLDGAYLHHVRMEWGPDSTAWRPDVHHRCSSPAVAIFPPPLIHTSEAVGTGNHQLVDVFGPPRRDFAEQPGWLLNERGTR